MLPNPAKPAGPTFPFTAPGIVKKGAALSPSGQEAGSQCMVVVAEQFHRSEQSLSP